MIDYEDVTSALTRLWKGKTKAIRLYRDGGRSATLTKDDIMKRYDLKPLKDPSCRYPWDDELCERLRAGDLSSIEGGDGLRKATRDIEKEKNEDGKRIGL